MIYNLKKKKKKKKKTLKIYFFNIIKCIITKSIVIISMLIFEVIHN